MAGISAPTDDDLKRIAADAVHPGMRLDDIAWSTNTTAHFRAIWDAAERRGWTAALEWVQSRIEQKLAALEVEESER